MGIGTQATLAVAGPYIQQYLIDKAVPQMAAVLSGMTTDELAICVVKDVDLSDQLPKYEEPEDLPDLARPYLRAYIEQAGDSLYAALLEATRNALRPTHPAHAALLGREKGAAWYRAHMERMRVAILAQMGA